MVKAKVFSKMVTGLKGIGATTILRELANIVLSMETTIMENFIMELGMAKAPTLMKMEINIQATGETI